MRRRKMETVQAVSNMVRFGEKGWDKAKSVLFSKMQSSVEQEA